MGACLSSGGGGGGGGAAAPGTKTSSRANSAVGPSGSAAAPPTHEQLAGETFCAFVGRDWGAVGVVCVRACSSPHAGRAPILPT